MSETDGRYDIPPESDSPPGRPLVERPNEAVPAGALDPRYDPVVGPPPRYALPADGAGSRDDDPDTLAGLPWDDGAATQPEYRDTPVVVRRPDSLAALLLLLAGIAAGVSLLVAWLHGGDTGLVLVANGFDDVSHPQRLVDNDTWEPLAVVFGGAALFLLALLMFVPAKTHRFLGALALLVTVVVAAGMLVPLAAAHWDVHRWAVGGWLSAAVVGLGLLGALKALMTNARRS